MVITLPSASLAVMVRVVDPPAWAALPAAVTTRRGVGGERYR